MEHLHATGKIVDDVPTSVLFGEMRGKMFGVMTCLAPDGSHIDLKAFSGQLGGTWLAPGWAPPLFPVDIWDSVNTPAERAIKHLQRAQGALPPEEAEPVVAERRKRSRKLMHDLHALYRLTNFRGETRPLTEVFPGDRGIATGTGDCCAPKLLNLAAINDLLPLSLCEFYWGRETRSGSRRHGIFYPPCQDKCTPILGFLLCGLEERYAARRM